MRVLHTPRLDLSALQVSRTALAAHAGTLAELVTDAATGRPGQRFAFSRIQDTDLWCVMDPRTTARYWGVTLVAAPGAALTPGAVRVTLSVTDGVTALPAAAVPEGLRGDQDVYAVAPMGGRLSAPSVRRWVLDTDPWRSVLDPAVPWRVRVQTSVTGDAWVELLRAEELPRWDHTQGVPPSAYLPAQPITDALSAVWTAAERALDATPRTLHATAAPESTPWAVVGVLDYAALSGDALPGGAPVQWQVAVRDLHPGVQPLRVGVRYRATGGGAVVRVHVSGHTIAVACPDTGGAWAWAWADGTAPSGVHALSWDAKRDATAVVQVSARGVVAA